MEARKLTIQCSFPQFYLSIASQSSINLICFYPSFTHTHQDNYNRISQEQKPKKSIKTKTKTIESTRQPIKRTKKKKRRNTQLVLAEPTTHIIPKQKLKQTIGQVNANAVCTTNNVCINPTAVVATSTVAAIAPPVVTSKQSIQPMINVVWNQDLFRKHSGGETAQIISAKSPALMTSMTHLPDNVMVYQLSNSMPNAQKIKIQNIISVGENSSTYESSEDTGVGELSESELMTAQDGIGMFYNVAMHCIVFVFSFSLFLVHTHTLCIAIAQQQQQKINMSKKSLFMR